MSTPGKQISKIINLIMMVLISVVIIWFVGIYTGHIWVDYPIVLGCSIGFVLLRFTKRILIKFF